MYERFVGTTLPLETCTKHTPSLMPQPPHLKNEAIRLYIQSPTFREVERHMHFLKILEMGRVTPLELRLGLFKAIRLEFGYERTATFLRKMLSVKTNPDSETGEFF